MAHHSIDMTEMRKELLKDAKEMVDVCFEHSATILARVLLLSELLIQKGLLTDEDVMEALSNEKVDMMMEAIDFRGENDDI